MVRVHPAQPNKNSQSFDWLFLFAVAPTGASVRCFCSVLGPCFFHRRTPGTALFPSVDKAPERIVFGGFFRGIPIVPQAGTGHLFPAEASAHPSGFLDGSIGREPAVQFAAYFRASYREK